MPKLTWYGNRAHTHRLVVRQPGVHRVNVETAESIAEKAGGFLAPHHANNADERDPGDSISHIEVTEGNVDAFASLVDADGGAAAIEYYLNPLKKAAGLEASGG